MLIFCLIHFSAISILAKLSAVTLWPQGILDARQELDGLSKNDNPISLAVFLTNSFVNLVYINGLRIPCPCKASIPGR